MPPGVIVRHSGSIVLVWVLVLRYPSWTWIVCTERTQWTHHLTYIHIWYSTIYCIACPCNVHMYSRAIAHTVTLPKQHQFCCGINSMQIITMLICLNVCVSVLFLMQYKQLLVYFITPTRSHNTWFWIGKFEKETYRILMCTLQ